MAAHNSLWPADAGARRKISRVGAPLALTALLTLALSPLAVAAPTRPSAPSAYMTPVCPAGSQLRAGDYTPAARFAHVIHVPGDQPTVQAGVNAAQPGDLVLVAPGIYRENVVVCTANITIRGEDRNSTILDGSGLAKHSNGFTVLASNVIIENMTAHNYDGNGFFWTYQTGFRGSYLTAYDNGDYGIYTYGSRLGELDHDYASGSPDSGFYIGQCFPCDAIITNIHSQYNGLGYSGTNAGGNLILKNSEWDHNLAGIVPNTLDGEHGPPERGTVITNNYVHDNGGVVAPYLSWSFAGQGVGIEVPGGDFNLIEHNRVENSSAYGILVLGNVDQNFWLASGNVVRDNTVRGSGIADLAMGAPIGANNCFSNNRAATTLPVLLEVTHPCGSPLALAGAGDVGVTLHMLAQFMHTYGPNFHSPDYRTFPKPGAQPSMPDVNAPPEPLFSEPFHPDDTGTRPYPAGVTVGGPAMLLPLGFTAYSIVQILLSLYGNLLLFALYAAWLAVAFMELSQRSDLTTGKRMGWGALVLAVPIVGPIVYYFAGGSKLSRSVRLGLVVGAPLVCLALAVALLFVAVFTL